MTNFPSPTPRCAIITGASNGIGAAIAERLARDGLAVVVNYAADDDAAGALALTIESAGGKVIAVKGDVASPSAVSALFDEAEQTFGGVDVLVANAGIMKLVPIMNTDDEMFDRHVAVNLKGVFNCLREAGRRMRSGGRIVNISSSVVGLYQPAYGVYAATKAGVEAFTHVFSKELRGRQITVNAVAPGPINTKLFNTGKSEELISQIARLAPLERIGEPQEVADVISFLTGADGGWVNGQVLRVNGGAI